MSITFLDQPLTDNNCAIAEQADTCSMFADCDEEPEICIGRYSVRDPLIIKRAAVDLMQQCLLHGCEIPDNVVVALDLDENRRHAMGMADVLLNEMSDLHERRAAICIMIHEIVRLS